MLWLGWQITPFPISVTMSNTIKDCARYPGEDSDSKHCRPNADEPHGEGGRTASHRDADLDRRHKWENHWCDPFWLKEFLKKKPQNSRTGTDSRLSTTCLSEGTMGCNFFFFIEKKSLFIVLWPLKNDGGAIHLRSLLYKTLTVAYQGCSGGNSNNNEQRNENRETEVSQTKKERKKEPTEVSERRRFEEETVLSPLLLLSFFDTLLPLSPALFHLFSQTPKAPLKGIHSNLIIWLEQRNTHPPTPPPLPPTAKEEERKNKNSNHVDSDLA